MPTYGTVADIPKSKGRETWDKLIAVLTAKPELQFLTSIRNVPVNDLTPQDSPMLSVVYAMDNWDQETVGRQAAWMNWYTYGLRLYVHYDGTNLLDKTMLCHDATAVLQTVLRGDDMRTQQGDTSGDRPFWYDARMMDKTTLYTQINERIFSTTRFQVRRRFKPGEPG